MRQTANSFKSDFDPFDDRSVTGATTRDIFETRPTDGHVDDTQVVLSSQTIEHVDLLDRPISLDPLDGQPSWQNSTTESGLDGAGPSATPGTGAPDANGIDHAPTVDANFAFDGSVGAPSSVGDGGASDAAGPFAFLDGSANQSTVTASAESEIHVDLSQEGLPNNGPQNFSSSSSIPIDTAAVAPTVISVATDTAQFTEPASQATSASGGSAAPTLAWVGDLGSTIGAETTSNLGLTWRAARAALARLAALAA